MVPRSVLLAMALAALAPTRCLLADNADEARLGEATYNQTCVACHLPNGKGIDKVNPPLAASDWVTGDDTDRLIRVVLHGLQGAVTVNGQPYFGLMPGHAPMLDDNQVAAVLTYIRASWGNKAGAIDPKRVAAVRAAYPGQTTPWTTDELKAPVPDGVVVEPAGDASAPLLTDLSFRYYEGKWTRLPDFASLKPVANGKLKKNVISIGHAKRKTSMAMVFTGKINVPIAGQYAFNLSSDDGSRLKVGGKVVVDHDGVHGNSAKAGKITLAAGAHDLEVQYFNALGPGQLGLVVSGPRIGTRALTPGAVKSGGDDPAFYLLVTDRPLVVRANLPDAGPRSIAVGLLNGINYVFDTETCTVRYGWFGQFLDAGPNRGHGRGRGGANCKLLGEKFNVGDAGAALAVATGGQKIEPVFTGYTRTGDAPAMRYRVAGVNVKQTVRGATGGLGVEYTFELDKQPAAPVTFAVNPAGLKLASSAGQWSNGVLTVPAAAARSFTVTLLVDRK